MKTSIARLLPGETVEFTVTRRTDMQERADFAQRRKAALDAMSYFLHDAETREPAGPEAPLTLTVDDVFARSQLYSRSSTEKKEVFHVQTIGEFRQNLGSSLRQVKQAFKDRHFTVRTQITHDYPDEFGKPCTAIIVNAKFFVTRVR